MAKILVLGLIFIFNIYNAYSATGKIPLVDKLLPSIDLVHPTLGILDPEDAKQRKYNLNNPLDLSILNPEENDIWTDTIGIELNKQLDEININSEDQLKYTGALLSSSETFRFTAESSDGLDSQIYQFMIHKNVHSYLLKKNIIRKLGFVVPSMKYLKKINISFSTIEDLNQFVKREIPEATFGAPTRWINKEDLEKAKLSLNLTLHDVVVMKPSVKDHYNLALGTPPKALKTRALKSLLLPYSLVNFNESANKVKWNIGAVKNQEILLEHGELSKFNISTDDAIWMARRISKLSRYDFEQMVMYSYYPQSVEKLLVEKLISRRNYLLNLILEDVTELPFDSKPNFGEELKNGKILKDSFAGYASRFVHGIPDSPFKDYHYYLFSKVQSEVFSNLISTANKALKVFEISNARSAYHKNLFQSGLEHFIKTGEFSEIGVGTWWSPTVNGKLILSRSIVIGNSFGTDNLIQTADTVGVSVSLGAHLGVEGLYQGTQLFASSNLSLLRTYTHLKPLKTLKQSVKEPYLNLVIPLLLYKLGKGFKDISKLKGIVQPDDDKEKELTQLMKYISKGLGVGESYIITDKLTTNVLAKAKYSFNSIAEVGVSVGGNGLVVKRLQIYRKNKNTIQIFDDAGKKASFNLNFELNAIIPILNLGYKKTKGNYKVRVTSINIDSDLDVNSNYYENALAISRVFKTGNTELIDSLNESSLIENTFLDKSFNLSFLFFKRKSLDTISNFTVTTKNGYVTKYLNLTDEYQKGKNYEAFVRDIVSYYIGKLFSGARLTSPKWKNAAHTLYGMSSTFTANYQSKIIDKNDNKYQYVSIVNKSEGFQIKIKDLNKMIKKINVKYERDFFPENTLKNTKKMMLFDVTTKIHLYKKALNKIRKLNLSKIKYFENKYVAKKMYLHKCKKRGQLNIKFKSRNLKKRKIEGCGYLNKLKRLIKKCHSKFNMQSTETQKGHCYMKISKRLVKDLEFKHFIEIVGEQNIYISGRINGYRLKSEVLMEPIMANTIGKISTRFKNGPVEFVRESLNMQNGEFYGTWIRESLK